MKKIFDHSYGVLLCILIGIISLAASSYISIGVVTLAIILGAITGNLFKLNNKFSLGIQFSEKTLLSWAVVFMGVKLNFMILKELGIRSIVLIVTAIAVTLFSALLLSRLLKFDKKFALLLGIGNGICGSSAIAATKDIIEADEDQVGLSIAIVNFLGTIGIFLIPFIGSFLLKLSDIHSGIYIGNTLQAVGQVVASGFSISDTAGQTATIVKMARILMLIPVVFILLFFFSKNNGAQKKDHRKATVPLFIIGFILFSLLPTFNLLSEQYIAMINKTSKYLLIVAMAAVGIKIKLSSILKHGKDALFIGSLIFLVQMIFSCSVIVLMF